MRRDEMAPTEGKSSRSFSFPSLQAKMLATLLTLLVYSTIVSYLAWCRTCRSGRTGKEESEAVPLRLFIVERGGRLSSRRRRFPSPRASPSFPLAPFGNVSTFFLLFFLLVPCLSFISLSYWFYHIHPLMVEQRARENEQQSEREH